MKVYSGHPESARVIVKSGKGKPKPIKFRATHKPAVISWGKIDQALAWICLAILDDLMPKQPDRALRLMQRFKYRVSAHWKPDIGWTLTEEEALAVVADIESTERETAQAVRMANFDPAPIVSDRGADIEWTKDPKLLINHPARKP